MQSHCDLYCKTKHLIKKLRSVLSDNVYLKFVLNVAQQTQVRYAASYVGRKLHPPATLMQKQHRVLQVSFNVSFFFLMSRSLLVFFFF